MPTLINFLRYPGSKRRLLNFLGAFLPTAKEIQCYYVEPFVGSGAVFFFIEPQQAILSDINADLIDLYLGIRHDPYSVWKYYSTFGNNKAEYHRVRDELRSGELCIRAARILYLNRTCFKGMWRHNLKGNFNVGYGGEDRRWVINRENLVELSTALRGADIRCSDFEAVIHACGEGDFLFVDPPYRPGEREQTNQHYAGKIFTYQDHVYLAMSLKHATQRGAQWALTISSHPDILKLYIGGSAVEFPIGTGRRPGVMVRHSGEVLITNYSVDGGNTI